MRWSPPGDPAQLERAMDVVFDGLRDVFNGLSGATELVTNPALKQELETAIDAGELMVKNKFHVGLSQTFEKICAVADKTSDKALQKLATTGKAKADALQLLFRELDLSKRVSP